ncbi:MAG: fatty acid desaturase [Parvularculaceae bacterium]|nr:fatty acid desaturase [Amphiplicatus sp.]
MHPDNISPRGEGESSICIQQEHSGSLNTRAIAARLSKQFAVRKADDTRRSVRQLLTTFIPFVALLAVMAAVMEKMYWLSLLLAMPTAGLLVRIFIFQHDCGHGSFFKSRVANDLLGRFLSIFTLTPYDHWKRSHAMHHATSGNLDKRGVGDVPTITVNEYLALSPLNRLGYRLFRNPVVMILIGAPVNFIVLQRLPLGKAFRERSCRQSILGLNLMLLIVFGTPMILWGVAPVLSIYLPVMIIAAWVGGWLFYIQHQFEDTYWNRESDWSFHDAAVSGSSYFELPRILQWFTGNIGLHHIHHLCSRIPNHRLQECVDANPELRVMAKRITLLESLKCWRLSLWDEEKGLLVGFSDVRRRQL